MKPHLRFRGGMWHCGLPCEHAIYWASAMTPEEAYALWARCRA